MCHEAAYRVQIEEIDGWNDVPETDFWELHRAKHKAETLMETLCMPTRVVKENGAVVWPLAVEPETLGG